MTLQHQTGANRRSSFKSAGPRPAEGRPVTSGSLFRTGIDSRALIMPGERVEDLEALIDEYYRDFPCISPTQRALVDLLILNEWSLRRMWRIESALWQRELAGLESTGDDIALAAAFEKGLKSLTAVERRIDALSRSISQTTKLLSALQKNAAPSNARTVAVSQAEVDPPRPATLREDRPPAAVRSFPAPHREPAETPALRTAKPPAGRGCTRA